MSNPMIRSLAAGFAFTGFFATQNARALQTMQSDPMTTPVPLPTTSVPIQVAVADPPEPPSAPSPTPNAPSASHHNEQGGTGSAWTYGHAGMFELGGFANFSGANTFTSIQVSPTAGFFIYDNLELTGILGFNYVHQTFDAGGTEVSNHKTIVRVLGEPSYHFAIGPTTWIFLGIGAGVASVPVGNDRSSVGFDVAPRVGANLLIGKSGLLSPALFIDYTTGEALQTNGNSLLGVNTTYGMQAGYTVMW
jgi:hypothetical protein